MRTDSKSRSWTVKNRIRVGESVNHKGFFWSNSTGKNGEPGVSLDWVRLSVETPKEVELNGLYVLTLGKTDLTIWENGDKFEGWVGNVYYRGRIVDASALTMPDDILDDTKVSLAINAPAI